jgi:rubrerythrin
MAEGGFFRVSEIVQMAIDEEHNGTIFYETLQKCAKSPALKEFAKQLAVEERGHERTFTDIRDRLGTFVPPETYPGEYADYVNVLVSGRTFPEDEDAAKLAREAGGDIQAIDAAIRFEKNTLLFLNEMRKLVPDRDQPTIEELVEEERRHLIDLTKVRADLA